MTHLISVLKRKLDFIFVIYFVVRVLRLDIQVQVWIVDGGARVVPLQKLGKHICCDLRKTFRRSLLLLPPRKNFDWTSKWGRKWEPRARSQRTPWKVSVHLFNILSILSLLATVSCTFTSFFILLSFGFVDMPNCIYSLTCFSCRGLKKLKNDKQSFCLSAHLFNPFSTYTPFNTHLSVVVGFVVMTKLHLLRSSFSFRFQ